MNEELKILDKECFDKVKINQQLAIEKKLMIKESYGFYQLLQALYRKALEFYLNQELNISSIDQTVKDSKLLFGVLPYHERDLYHQSSSLASEYLYVRNFLFVEKLDFSDLSLLYSRIKEKRYMIDQSLIELVKRTYQTVMRNNYIKGTYQKKPVPISFTEHDPLPSNIFLDNTLVFKFRYGKNAVNLSDQKFLDNLKKKKIFLKQLKEELEGSFSTQLKCKVGIII